MSTKPHLHVSSTPIKHHSRDFLLRHHKHFYESFEAQFVSYEYLNLIANKIALRQADPFLHRLSDLNICSESINLEPTIDAIYFLIRKHLDAEPLWQELLLRACHDMMHFNFSEQPSVNLNQKDDCTVLITKARIDKTLLEKLASVSLLDHTYHVVNEAVEMINSSEFLFDKEERILLLFGALLHDFGKSLALMQFLNISTDGVTQGQYNHAQFSSLYLIEVCSASQYKKENLEQCVALQDIIKQHHVDGRLKALHPMVQHVVESDRRARQLEQFS